mgnify:CR=1 FL=1
MKPAVISVQVQMDETADAADLSSNEEDNPPPTQGSPLEKFFSAIRFRRSAGRARPSSGMIVIGADPASSFHLTAMP